MLNFTYEEVVRSHTAINNNIVNDVPKSLMNNLMRATVGIQKVRDLLKVPILISSWYRCEELNKLIGGSLTSHHKKCLAIDFTPKGMDLKTAIELIKNSDILYDQLIFESKGKTTWIHISFAPTNRRQTFDIIK